MGCKVHRMSVNDALAFYGPVQEALHEKLAPKIGEKARVLLEEYRSCKLGKFSLEQPPAEGEDHDGTEN